MGIVAPPSRPLLGSIALTISAKLKVPFYPVPMTMQVFAVLALGLILGFRLGVAGMREGGPGERPFSLIYQDCLYEER